MNNLTLLLTEYEFKRELAKKKLEEKKKKVFSQNKRLKEIENELNSISLNTIKKLLLSSNDNVTLLKNLQQKKEELSTERLKILNSLNLTSADLNPVYECSVCNDTGYVFYNSHSEMCKCFKQKLFNLEYNQSNLSNISTQTFDKFNLEYYSNNPDIKKYNFSISPRENINSILNICKKFIKNFDNFEEKNLLFLGNTGLGKTFLSTAIANEILKKQKTVLYQTAPVMLDMLIDYQFNKTPKSINIHDNILSVDLLIIDDLGTETMNKLKFTELFEVINTRLLNQENKITKTIISSNLTLNDISSNYDERIISRLIGHYNICKFFGEDIRLIK